jgi:hypothetical protein
MTRLTPWALFATGALAPCRSHAFGTASPDFDARRKWFAELRGKGLAPGQEDRLEGVALLVYLNDLKLTADEVALTIYIACMNRP